MANEQYELVVIGAGPGGYVAAIRAAQLGLKVAVVEKRATLGGTCLNVGCIPSKALLQSSHLFEEAGHDLGAHGIVVAAPSLDFAQLMKRKNEVVGATTKGVEFLFKKNKIAWLVGTGRIERAGEVAVLGPDGTVKDTLATGNVLIASGSEVTPLPGVAIDEKKIDPRLIRRVDGWSRTHAAVGTIHYPAKGADPEMHGQILYFKSSLTDDEPEDVEQYHSTHPSFPHETTANQFFTESQFESYRRLGLHIVEKSLDTMRIL